MHDEAAVPLPERRDLRQALQIYVTGRSRFWSADEKRAAAEKEAPRPGPGAHGSVESEWDSTVGVPIPETLQFDRAAGTWRDKIPGGRRRRSGSRSS